MTFKVSNVKRDTVFLLFCLCIVLHLLPVWIYQHFPTEDGPSHVHNSAVMLNLLTAPAPAFREYYQLQATVAGNLTSQIILMGLLSVMSGLLADKVFLSIFIVLLCTGFWRAIAAVSSDAKWLAFLIFPFVYSSWLHLGFYNFCIGMALSLFVITYCIRNLGNLGLRQTGILALLFLALYFSHISVFGVVAVTVAALTVVRLVWERRQHEHLASKPSVNPSKYLLLAIVPPVILLILFLSRYTMLFKLHSLRFSAWRIYSLAPLVARSDVEYWFGKAVVAVVGVVTIFGFYSKWKDRRLRPLDGLLLAAAGLTLLIFMGPDAIGWGGLIQMRLVFYVYFALILWLAAQQIPPRVAKGAAAASVLISVLLFATRAPAYAELNRQIEEYLSTAPHIDPNTTLLALSFASHGYAPPENRLAKTYLPFEYLSGFIGTDKPVVDLGNYETLTFSFWTRFRPEVDPFRFVNKVVEAEIRPAAANLFGYPPESGGRIDYVLLWGLGLDKNGVPRDPPKRLGEQLGQAYDRIYVSSGRQLAQLYRRKDYVKTAVRN
jgi:hypothetical protein